MLNNSQLTLAMPYIPKFAVILSSLRSVIPAQGRRSREASSIKAIDTLNHIKFKRYVSMKEVFVFKID